MVDWNLIGTKIVGIICILIGIFYLMDYKQSRSGQEAFTGRWITEVTTDYGKVFAGIILIVLGALLVINP